MKWILPLKIRKKGYLKLPQTICELPKAKIVLDNFEDDLKLKLLPIQSIKKNKNGNFRVVPIETKSNNYLNKWIEFAQFNLCYTIEYTPEKNNLNDWYIINILKLLESINLVIIKHGLPNYFQIDNKKGYDLRSESSRKYTNNEFDTISLSNIREIQQLFECYRNLNDVDRTKLAPLLELIGVKETKGNPKGIRCALMVTVLESLFSKNDEKSEIRYRFPLRMTATLKGSYEKDFKYIKKLYDKRSAYYHTGIDKFSHNDEEYLNQKIKRFLIQFFENPNFFNGSEIDKRIIER